AQQHHVRCPEAGVVRHAMPEGPHRTALRRCKASGDGDVWFAYENRRAPVTVYEWPKLASSVIYHVQDRLYGFYIDINGMAESTKVLQFNYNRLNAWGHCAQSAYDQPFVAFILQETH